MIERASCLTGNVVVCWDSLSWLVGFVGWFGLYSWLVDLVIVWLEGVRSVSGCVCMGYAIRIICSQYMKRYIFIGAICCGGWTLGSGLR